MNERQILEELLAVLEANGVAIRSEPLGGSGGGLASLKDRKVFFLDTQAPSAEVAALAAEAVAGLVDIENVYVKPEVRDFIKSEIRGTSEY